MAYEVTKVHATQQPGMVFFGKLNYLGFFWEKYVKNKEKEVEKEITVHFYLLLLSLQCNL